MTRRKRKPEGLVVRCQCGDLTGIPCKGWSHPSKMLTVDYRPKWCHLQDSWAQAIILVECGREIYSNLVDLEASRV